MKKMVFTAVIALVTLSVFGAGEIEKAEQTAVFNLRGTVVDQTTGETLAGVGIKVKGINQTIYTDFEGNFEVKDLAPGNYNLSTSMISYEDESITINANSNRVNINIEPVQE